jgi:primosomal replication protein N
MAGRAMLPAAAGVLASMGFTPGGRDLPNLEVPRREPPGEPAPAPAAPPVTPPVQTATSTPARRRRVPHMNRVQLVAEVGMAPEVRTTESGVPIFEVRVFTTSTWGRNGDRTRTDWHTVVVFGQRVPELRDSIRKGQIVLVEGSLKQTHWTIPGTNDVRWRTEIVADRIEPFED